MVYEIYSNAVMYYGMKEKDDNTILIQVEQDQPIDRDRLERAVNLALRRYPYFAVRLQAKPDRLLLEDNPNWVKIHENLDLYSGDNGDFLFRFSSEDRTLKVIYSHALTDGHGFLPFLKTVLAVYYSEEKKKPLPISAAINLPESEVRATENTEPLDLLDESKAVAMPQDINVNTYTLPEDDGVYSTVYPYRISVSNSQMQSLVQALGGSYTSVISALFCEAICSVHEIPENQSVVCTSIIDRKPLLGCPDSHYLSMHPASFVMDGNFIHRPLTERVGAIRTDLRKKMQGEVFGMGLQIKKLLAYLTSLPTLEQKRQMCQQLSSQTRSASTFTVSYWGKLDFDWLESHIVHIGLQAAAHPMLIEACAHGNTFDITLLQTFQTQIYADAFKQILLHLTHESSLLN